MWHWFFLGQTDKAAESVISSITVGLSGGTTTVVVVATDQPRSRSSMSTDHRQVVRTLALFVKVTRTSGAPTSL